MQIGPLRKCDHFTIPAAFLAAVAMSLSALNLASCGDGRATRVAYGETGIGLSVRDAHRRAWYFVPYDNLVPADKAIVDRWQEEQLRKLEADNIEALADELNRIVEAAR